MSGATLDPAELRRQRKARRAGEAGGNGVPARREESAPEQVVAQGRPQPMIRPDDLPEVVDAPDAVGPLTEDERERWELCQRSFAQYQQAWWVAARALDIALRGRLWRADYETAAAFIGGVAGMSTSNAYRQIAGAEVAALLASPASIEHESNDLSRMRDSAGAGLRISQRAAEALGPIREDYGPELAADAYRAVAEVTGRDTVSQRLITGVVQQLPRREDEDLDQGVLLGRVRALAAGEAERAADAAAGDPVQALREYVAVARRFASDTRGLSRAYQRAAAVNPRRAQQLAERLHGHMERATGNFPDA
ncbi:hypothetical protein [Streptomyces otsuchiensis]|uniref:hypothetical protein n=1 Tax=Streptomyces otsuchiensis TaxID=2681388 RepID=UPI001031517A|nr:hypothetical protein [Streptomyces otsuchiensis]